MDKALQQFQHLKLQLEEIRKATNNFNDETNCIGVGGFGNVYKGEVAHSEGRSTAAIKRLNRNRDQGDAEFLKEIRALSRYKHENLISLLGFCYQEKEAILVYHLASRGSLDQHIGSRDLMWTLRLNICLGAAKGLRHLHDPKEAHQRLIHCDVKSANILLDDRWNAKVSDFGFSTMGPANELYSTVIKLPAGTLGYCDPQYVMESTLTKESYVYSFGVVLVEVLCGALCYTNSNGSIQYDLVPTWIKSYEEKTLNDTVFKDSAIQPLHEIVLEIFSDIAYRCLKVSREDRPEMADVVRELETALDMHELLQNQEFLAKWNAESFFYKALARATDQPPLNYRSEVELMKLLFKGVLVNNGKTWFSVNKKGEPCEMISIAECFLDLNPKSYQWSSEYNSRFPVGTYHLQDGMFNARVIAQFLSPGVTYTVNLVFKYGNRIKRRKWDQTYLKYKLQGERENFLAHLAYEREDGWWVTELYQFTCEHRIFRLQILFDTDGYSTIQAEGIEFRPLENVEHKEEERQPISDSDLHANWEEKMPTDYEEIIRWSINGLQWTTKEEAYVIMSKGFLIGKLESGIWFSLDKYGKKCYMLSALIAGGSFQRKTLRLLESRFGEAIQYDYWNFHLKNEVLPRLVSSQTSYAIYLVYKLSKDNFIFKAPMRVRDMEILHSKDKPEVADWYIYLVSPQTPVINPKAAQKTHNPTNKLIKESLPQQRNDGWMEVQLSKFRSSTATKMIPMHLELEIIGDRRENIRGLIIEGIDIRPI